MIDVKIDISKLKNEIAQIHSEAFKGLNATNDGERRDILNRVAEKLRTLKARLEEV